MLLNLSLSVSLDPRQYESKEQTRKQTKERADWTLVKSHGCYNWQKQDLNSGSGAFSLGLVQLYLPFPPCPFGFLRAGEQLYGCSVKSGLMSVIW